MKSTWKPDEGASSTPDNQKNLPDSAFAFPGKRKEPMTDASHVRNAIARFDQVKDVTDLRTRASLRQPQGRRQALQSRPLPKPPGTTSATNPTPPNKAARKSAKKMPAKTTRKATE